MLAGLALVGIGTFFAQATATGFVSRTATADRGSASGLYLASYFFGGLVGSAVLGQVFDRFGWAACVAGIGLGARARGAAYRNAARKNSRGNSLLPRPVLLDTAARRHFPALPRLRMILATRR